MIAISIVAVRSARRTACCARRWAVGADAEDRVADELAVLRPQGWSVQHGVSWPRRGDVDHVVVTPTGTVFAVETKAARYTPAHLDRTRAAAGWLATRERTAVTPVLVIASRDGIRRWHDGVLVVSLDRLVPALSTCGGGRRRRSGRVRPGSS